MRRLALVAAVSMGLVAGCQQGDHASSQARADKPKAAQGSARTLAALPQRREGESFANAPDRGALLSYSSEAPVKKGAYTWHEVQLSEAHALRAIATGTMEIPAPDGTPIRLKYVSHSEHPDGNWTWVGRADGAKPGQEAVITFGKDAVFATIPNGRKEALQLTTTGGRGYLIETDPKLVAADAHGDADFLAPTMDGAAAMLPTPKRASAAGAQRLQTANLTASKSATVGTTVDIVLGYTNAFSTRLGGVSQAQTRLNFIVDMANQAYINTEIDGRLRLVTTVPVNYTDTNTNRTALFELSGVTCTPATGSELPDGGVSCTPAAVPAALQPLVAARDSYGADLMALVRTFQDPEQGSCGLAWMLGGGQSALDAADAPFAVSVISDTSGSTFPDPDTNTTCRNETLAHETGHNFGLQHDVDTADRSDNVLQPEEFGHFAYSFGYVASPANGNFYEVMAIRRPGLNSYNVFSNPDITFCGGFACGVPDQADNARALRQTIPIVAAFRAARVPITGTWLRGDYNGDGSADLLWRNRNTGQNVIWRSGNAQTPTAMRSLPDQAWQAIGSADFNGDGSDDVVWRNATTGQSVIWRSGNANTSQNLGNPAGWRVVGAGDFNGDGSDDVLWRNDTTGGNLYWRSANSTTTTLLQGLVGPYWTVVGIGDFDNDGKSDILWRNFSTGQNVVWRSGLASTATGLSTLGFAWAVAGVGDFDGDGFSDILWRNQTTGQNAIWRSGNSATAIAVQQLGLPWAVMGVGDFNNDGRDDIVWRNLGNGLNGIWLGGNASTAQTTLGLATFWFIAG